MESDMEFDRDALIQTFLAETEDHLSQMEEALVGLEEQPKDEELLATVFRVAHTVKGNCSVLELPVPEGFAHVLEGLLDRARSGALPVTSSLITLLLAAADALREMVPEAIAGASEMRPAHREVLDHLTRAAAGEAPDAEAPVSHPSVAGEEAGGARSRTLRVDRDKLDRMLDLTGEIAVARGRLLRKIEDLGAAGADALEAAREVEQLSLGLQEIVMSARMVPVGPTFRRYLRTVRDIAAANGREARLVIEGEDVEVDTSVIERLGDPLTHMIRNALDHGIEPPDVRVGAGKEACGTLTLRAFHEAGSVVVQVVDDGAGLSRARILLRAREAGLVAETAAPTEAEIQSFIFEPGFSTAESVTTLSGRGVGMDVVRRNIEALRGTIAIASEPGRGTTITIRLPLTLAIIEGLAVGVGDETYIVPIDAVVECIDLPEAERQRPEPSGVIGLRGKALPYARLRHLFGVPAAGRSAHEQVVVVRRGDGLVGIAVDALYGESQTVIKPLDRMFQKQAGISGSTILNDGRVALIVDVSLLLDDALAPAEVSA
jgi:two-component system, chemotaxis family, sensor kinase CheA